MPAMNNNASDGLASDSCNTILFIEQIAAAHLCAPCLPNALRVMHGIIGQVTSLTHRHQVSVVAIFRLVIEMRDREHNH